MLPVALNLAGLPVLIVGGGRVAARRARTLQDQGAHITVISPQLDRSMHELLVFSAATPPIIRWCPRSFKDTDVAGNYLVISHATEEINNAVSRACREACTPCLVGGQRHKSSLWFMAHAPVRAEGSSITVAVSANGNPRLARRTVERLKAFFEK